MHTMLSKICAACKARLPKGIYGRSLLILILPLVLFQICIVYIFLLRYWLYATSTLTQRVVQEVAFILEQVDQKHSLQEQKRLLFQLHRFMHLDIRIYPQGTPLPPIAPSKGKVQFFVLDQLLHHHIKREFQVPATIVDPFADKANPQRKGLVLLRFSWSHGRTVDAVVARSLLYPSKTHIFLVWALGIGLALLLIAVLFLKGQVKFIKRLAEFAELLGRGVPVKETIPPAGALEIRQTTSAILQMKERIERSVMEHALILSGVSHDLRTMLEQFTLKLSMLRPPRIEEGKSALLGDIHSMQAILASYLDYAKGDTNEPFITVDVCLVLSSLLERYGNFDGKLASFMCFHNGKTIPFAHAIGIFLMRGQVQLLERCFFHILMNAAQHSPKFHITLIKRGTFLCIEVDDEGEGIALEDRKKVLLPFHQARTVRREEKESTSGGTAERQKAGHSAGLGLTIAHTAVMRHGGILRLSSSKKHTGLQVRLHFRTI